MKLKVRKIGSSVDMSPKYEKYTKNNLENRNSAADNQFNNLQLERNKKVFKMWQTVILILLIVSSLYESTSASPLTPQTKHRHHHHSTISSTPQPAAGSSDTKTPLEWKIKAGSKYSESPTGNGIELESNHDAEPTDFAPNDDKEDASESIEKIPTKCPQCKNSDTLSEDDLTKLRIEYVKQQILKKLQLTERPPVLKKSDLPEPVQIGYEIESDKNEEMFLRRADAKFAKTTQKIVFMTQGWYKSDSSSVDNNFFKIACELIIIKKIT